MKKIPLTQGKVAIVDDSDFELVAKFRWSAMKVVRKNRTIWYAIRTWCTGKDAGIRLMHRLITEGKSREVDHVNGDGLDNRRLNLRSSGNGKNQRNQRKRIGCSSRFKGVAWDRHASRWAAYIMNRGKRFHLGLFRLEQDAADAYDAAAEQHFGEFALTNKAMKIS
jgi:hypothetical protein